MSQGFSADRFDDFSTDIAEHQVLLTAADVLLCQPEVGALV